MNLFAAFVTFAMFAAAVYCAWNALAMTELARDRFVECRHASHDARGGDSENVILDGVEQERHAARVEAPEPQLARLASRESAWVTGLPGCAASRLTLVKQACAQARPMFPSHDDWMIVRACELFRGVPDAIVRGLLSGRPPTVLNKGQVLFHQGDPAAAFFVVLEGWMKIYRAGADGREIIIHVAKAGETFAEAAMFMEGAYPVHAEAATAVRLQRIDGRSVRERIAADPSFAFSMLGAMSLRLRRLVNEIERLKRRSAIELVAEFLLQLCAPGDAERCTLSLPFEKAIIAARLGITPESFSRALSRLRAIGVEVSGAEVTISSRSALARMMNRASPGAVPFDAGG